MDTHNLSTSRTSDGNMRKYMTFKSFYLFCFAIFLAVSSAVKDKHLVINKSEFSNTQFINKMTISVAAGTNDKDQSEHTISDITKKDDGDSKEQIVEQEWLKWCYENLSDISDCQYDLANMSDGQEQGSI